MDRGELLWIWHAPTQKYYAFDVYKMNECFAHWCLLKSNSKNCVLSLGSRHSVDTRNLSPKTREKVCIWCVFDSYTHSVSVQKLSLWYCFRKWCPGAAHLTKSFPSSGINLLKTSRILIVYHTARPKHKRNCPTVCLAPAMQSPVIGWVVRSTSIRGGQALSI